MAEIVDLEPHLLDPTPLDPILLGVRPDQWEIIRGLLNKHVPQFEVWAFGSRVKGNRWANQVKPFSDLDLCIITDHPLTLEELTAITDDFSDSDLPWKVDIVDWATTSEHFRKIIEANKAILQTAKPRKVSDQGLDTL